MPWRRLCAPSDRGSEEHPALKALYIEQGTVTVREAPAPEPLPGFARIRLLVAGICNTDLELLRGYHDFTGIPGHEFVGEVVDGPAEWLGRRVVGEINLACGHCETCAAGMRRHCPNRTVLGIVRHPGAFAELLTLPTENLRAVPDDLSNEEAVFAEPVAAACAILEQVTIRQGQGAAVLGDGKLALLIAQVLRSAGARVRQYGRHPEKLAISQRNGIDTERNDGNLPKAEYELVVEATGSASGLSEAIRMTRPRGTVVMKSTVHGEVAFDAAAVIVNEIRLLGSRCGLFEPALELLRTKAVAVSGMIDSRYALHQGVAAFERAQTRGALKVLLQ